jgi:glycosyltransferase involved in cell wall biosynthesis
MKHCGQRKLLVVARWPLGGIRTYMKYTYKYLPADHYNITILASHTVEDDAIKNDAKAIGANLIFSKGANGNASLFIDVYKVLLKGSFDLIQSHGFISACHVAIANLCFSIPHILTIHGIFETRHFKSNINYKLQKSIMQSLINKVDIVYSVSSDILNYVEEQLCIKSKVRRIVIHNGIDIELFDNHSEQIKYEFRHALSIPEGEFLIGFLGRFMPQKGFNYLIEAVDILKKSSPKLNFKVLAVGSDDYQREYRNEVLKKGLGERFIFAPFQNDMRPIYDSLDLVAMPSVWEAFGLQAAEALCSGVPLVASDCVGLREAIRGTPAMIVPSRDSRALAEAIKFSILNDQKPKFSAFRPEAMSRYDVRITASQLNELFESSLWK